MGVRIASVLFRGPLWPPVSRAGGDLSTLFLLFGRRRTRATLTTVAYGDQTNGNFSSLYGKLRLLSMTGRLVSGLYEYVEVNRRGSIGLRVLSTLGTKNCMFLGDLFNKTTRLLTCGRTTIGGLGTKARLRGINTRYHCTQTSTTLIRVIGLTSSGTCVGTKFRFIRIVYGLFKDGTLDLGLSYNGNGIA